MAAGLSEMMDDGSCRRGGYLQQAMDDDSCRRGGHLQQAMDDGSSAHRERWGTGGIC